MLKKCQCFNFLFYEKGDQKGAYTKEICQHAGFYMKGFKHCCHLKSL
jgi:hypothetical protein